MMLLTDVLLVSEVSSFMSMMDSNSMETTKEPLDPSVSLSTSNLLGINETKKRPRNNLCLFKYCKSYWKEIKARSLNVPVILLLIYSVPTSLCTVVLYNIANGLLTPPCTDSATESNPTYYSLVTLSENILYLLIPLSGWISDVKIGRGNAVYFSLWIGWIGTLFQTLSTCFQYSSCGIVASVGKHAISGIAIIFLLVSMSFLYANLLAYGMDQLMMAPSIKVRAFIYWYVWIIFVAGNVSSYTSFLSTYSISYHNGTLTVAFTAFLLFSLSLSLHFQFKDLFEHIPIPNPYKTVVQVLRYVTQNKYPQNRSAFTYWGREVPNRMDFAKDKFGGPFTHESVENVKTFLRILTVLAALCPFLIASDPFINGITSFVDQFTAGSTALKGNAQFTVWFVGDNIVLLAVPLIELVILPLFPKLEYFLINPLKGLGVAILCIVLSISSVFLTDLLGRIINKQPDITCFTLWIPGDLTINISYWVLLLPAILAGIADAMSLLCVFEFLCSQAPFGMHGMLIGLFWFLRALCIDIGSFVTLVFHVHPFSGPISMKMSCTSWFTIVLGLVALIGLVVYTITARWYVRRVRDDDLDLRTTIEEHFEQQLMQEESFMKRYHNKDEIIVICDSNVST